MRASPRGPPAAWRTPRSLLAPPPQVGFHLHGRCLRLPSILQDVCPPLLELTPRSGPGTWVSRGLRTIRTDCRVPSSGRQQARVYGGHRSSRCPGHEAQPAQYSPLPNPAPRPFLHCRCPPPSLCSRPSPYLKGRMPVEQSLREASSHAAPAPALIPFPLPAPRHPTPASSLYPRNGEHLQGPQPHPAHRPTPPWTPRTPSPSPA